MKRLLFTRKAGWAAYALILLLCVNLLVSDAVAQNWSPSCSPTILQERWVADYYPLISAGRSQQGHSVEQVSPTVHGISGFGGYLMAGQTSFFGATPISPATFDFYFVLANRDGTLFLDAAIGGVENDVCWSAVDAIQNADQTQHGVIGVGYTESFGPMGLGNRNVMITRTSKTLVPQQSWVYGFADRNDEARKIKAVSANLGGGFIVVGDSDDQDPSTATFRDCYVVRLDASGARQWELLVGDLLNDYAYDVEEFDDGVNSGFVIVGYREDFSVMPFRYELQAFWIDNSGAILRYRRYGINDPNHGVSDERGYSVQVIKDATGIATGYVFAGEATYQGQSNALVMRTNSTGDMTSGNVWIRAYGTAAPGFELAREVRWAPNPQGVDQFVFLGDWGGNGFVNTDMFFTALDGNGVVTAARALGNTQQHIETGYGLERSDDGGFITVGTRNYQGGGFSPDVYAQKLDCNLNNDCEIADITPDTDVMRFSFAGSIGFLAPSYPDTDLLISPQWDVEQHPEDVLCYSFDPDPDCCAPEKPTYQSFLDPASGRLETGAGIDRNPANGNYYVFGQWEVPSNACVNNTIRNLDATISMYSGAGAYVQTMSFGGSFDEAATSGLVFTDPTGVPQGLIFCGYNNTPPAVTANQNEDAYVVWTDLNAGLAQEFKYGGFDTDRAHNIRQVFDRGVHTGFVITGFSRSWNTGNGSEVYTVYFNPGGVPIFASVNGGLGEDIGWSVTPVYLRDGDPATLDAFAVVGETTSYGPGPRAIYYLLLDIATGAVLQAPVTYGGNFDDVGYSIQEVSDNAGNGLVIAAETNSASAGTDYDAFVFRIDYAGNYLEVGGGISIRHIYGHLFTGENDGARSIKFTSDLCGTEYHFTGYTNDQTFQPLQDNAYLVKINETGGLIFGFGYGLDDNDRSFDVIKNIEGGYSMAGWSQPAPAATDPDEYFITTACNGTTDDQNGMPCQYTAVQGALLWLQSQQVTQQNPTYSNHPNNWIIWNGDSYEVGICNGMFPTVRCPYQLNPNKQGTEPGDEVMLELADQGSLSLYPNPIEQSGELTIALDLQESAHYDIVIRDLLGKTMYRSDREFRAGRQSLRIITSEWTPGSYMVTVKRNEFIEQRAMLIVR